MFFKKSLYLINISLNMSKFQYFSLIIHYFDALLQIIWFSAMFPYVVLTILCCKALTLDGAWDGIKYLFTPKWELLTQSQCWIDGGTQIFYSYGVGIGALLALGSYNKFNHNCYRYFVPRLR